uniref:Uncharacterized protein n=1 Tax=Caenorhabditis brenneri TaxID=135651 RepID=B6VBG2_CAEBE|nr:hypothetical protein Cbre_JD08.007 [Caenorhabditis brenneri]
MTIYTLLSATQVKRQGPTAAQRQANGRRWVNGGPLAAERPQVE